MTTSHDLYLVEARNPHSQLQCHITKHAQVLQTLKMLQISLIKAIPKQMAEISIQNVQWKLADNQPIKRVCSQKKWEILSLFTHHHVVPNLYDFHYFNVEELFFSLQ